MLSVLGGSTWAGRRETLVPFVRYHNFALSSLNPFLAGEGKGKEAGMHREVLEANC